MPKIQILSKAVAELIAAGEVVERPASVVKELAENAMDAGAKNITIEIQNGGARMLRLTDDGCGIAREDVQNAFLSHATSKVFSAEDLNEIRSLGFRGEALPSIAAVSRVEILTRGREEEIGTRYEIAGGEAGETDDAGCPVGTTIVVRDLFFNTPARMKFLKKDVSEANAVAAVADRLALSNPDISFRLIREGKQTLFTPGSGDLLETARAVFGKEFAQGLMPVSYEMDGIKVKGFTSKPAAARPNRNMQFFFVNGRLIKTGTGSAALSEGYKNAIMVGKFPSCILSLTLHPSQVDVNVHPAKIEVRFAQERSVFSAVYFAVKSALSEGDTPAQFRAKPPAEQPTAAPAKQMYFPEKKPDFWKNISVTEFLGEPKAAESPVLPSLPSEPLLFSSPEPELPAGAEPSPLPPPQAEVPTAAEPAAEVPVAQEEPPAQELLLLGEAFRSYLIVQQGEELVFIDKHAAHERMLYEQLKASAGERSAQQLLQPVIVSLSKEEYAALLEHTSLLEQAGFSVADFGPGTVAVHSCPMELSAHELPQVMAELAEQLLRGSRELLPEKLDWIYHSVACRAAVKAGDFTSRYEQEHFARKLLALPDIRYCPHGRPVLFRISRRELEKSFGRIQ